MTALLPACAADPMLGFAIYWVIGRQLRSVRDAAQEVSGRSPFDAGAWPSSGCLLKYNRSSTR